MKIRLSLLLLCSSLFASFAGAKVFDGLVIPNGEYRTLPIAVFVTPNTLGLGEDDVYRATKLRLLANKIQTIEIKSAKDFNESGYFLFVAVNFLGDRNIFSTTIELKKDTRKNLKQVNHFLGTFITPEQDSYDGFGIASSDTTVINSLNGRLDKFLLDYLESNLQVEVLRENIRKLEEEGKLE
jgi:hypothetical protein